MKTTYFLTFILSLSLLSCESQNHIDKYGFKIEKLCNLPDNIYAYRRGSIFINNGKNLIWFSLDKSGNIKDLENITEKGISMTHSNYTGKDSLNLKEQAQEFIRLSGKYKFGYINIDRKNKIALSYIDGLPEQFVKPLNDSIKNLYSGDKDFKLLANGWFESITNAGI